MALESRLFTDPPDTRLEACLVRDDAHILTGAVGPHVACIQIALSLLSDGEVFLVIDGVYGEETAEAVFDFKDAREILGPGQVVPDRIVGKRTLQALDDEMSVFEEENATDELVSLTVLGSPHDHPACPLGNFTAPGAGDRTHHFGTPVNPLLGRSINISGEGETAYLGFEDFLFNATIGPPRPFTPTLPDHSVQNICMRDSPLLMNGSRDAARAEILRIAAPRCRFTFCGDMTFLPDLLLLGTVDRDYFVTDPRYDPAAPAHIARILVITIS